MRITLIVATALLWSTAQAATITFDDMPVAGYDISFTTPQGYTFTKSSPFGPFGVASDAGDNYLLADGPAYAPFVTLTQSAGQAFQLHQIDLLFIDAQQFFGGCYGGTCYETDVLIRAKDQFGNLIAEVSVDHTLGLGWRTVTFDSSWENIAKLEMSGSVLNSGFPIAAGGYDNIVVTTVPIPAAVWLFSSTLAGLGWLRLRKKV